MGLMFPALKQVFVLEKDVVASAMEGLFGLKAFYLAVAKPT